MLQLDLVTWSLFLRVLIDYTLCNALHLSSSSPNGITSVLKLQAFTPLFTKSFLYSLSNEWYLILLLFYIEMFLTCRQWFYQVANLSKHIVQMYLTPLWHMEISHHLNSFFFNLISFYYMVLFILLLTHKDHYLFTRIPNSLTSSITCCIAHILTLSQRFLNSSLLHVAQRYLTNWCIQSLLMTLTVLCPIPLYSGYMLIHSNSW